MPANVIERISIALSIGGKLISSVETLPPRNPNFAKFNVLFVDGSRLHVNEDWRGDRLSAYSYYWLDSADNLIVGWDDSKHHPRLENFPHHKHIDRQAQREPSYETTLEEVLVVIKQKLTATP
jgi:Family of unknown function (DUF6516)